MMLNHFVALVSPKMKQKVAAKHLEKAQQKAMIIMSHTQALPSLCFTRLSYSILKFQLENSLGQWFLGQNSFDNILKRAFLNLLWAWTYLRAF